MRSGVLAAGRIEHGARQGRAGRADASPRRFQADGLTPQRLVGLEGESVEAGRELGRQRLVDQTVFRQPREPGELCRAYPDGIVRLAAGGCAGVAMV